MFFAKSVNVQRNFAILFVKRHRILKTLALQLNRDKIFSVFGTGNGNILHMLLVTRSRHVSAGTSCSWLPWCHPYIQSNTLAQQQTLRRPWPCDQRIEIPSEETTFTVVGQQRPFAAAVEHQIGCLRGDFRWRRRTS